MSLTLCGPMDCSPQGSSVHGILQARTLEWMDCHSLLQSTEYYDLNTKITKQLSNMRDGYF